ncbi:MFS transporter [Staphylococcus sp. 18_1_E_LY]|uniref:MFS transporter n=1 Tax=Staphylococcus lloydii TaxID=2781774 RepID=A0A7T1B0B0_9STAP|nr:MFS transporter [Staphylococcus lloydii]MBF7020046.1 MFS transporter [Staphylococcus lloydii]MBF7027729.1 MFS transporter [Staphylococcus lloydii]QPM75409.1 MFS transporter [Staphylococcus lloydii]
MKIINTTNEKLIVLVTCLGMFLSTLDTGIINVALPTLTKEFDSNLTILMWTVTLYTLMLVSFIIMFGKLGDAIGKMKIFNLGVILFGFSSLLCALSSTEFLLIAFRGMQGIGASMVQATAAALIGTQISNQKQGKALGIFSIAIGLGPIFGPSLGSFLLNFSSWPMLFLINIPFVLLIIVINQFLMKNIKEKTGKLNFDFLGNGLLIIMLSTLILAITFLKSKVALILIAVCLLSLWSFIKYEKRIMNPLVPLSWLSNKYLLSLLYGIFTLGGSMALGFVIPPFYIEQNLKLNSLIVGFVNLSAPLGMVISSHFSNKLINKFHNQSLLMISIMLMGLTYLIIGLIQDNILIWQLIVLLTMFGIGCGIYLPINTGSLLNLVKQSQQATAGSLQRMVQNLGIALYSAISSFVITISNNYGNSIQGYKILWITASITLLISFIVTLKMLVNNQNINKKLNR